MEAKYQFIRDDVFLRVRVSEAGVHYLNLQKINKKTLKVEFEQELDCIYTCIVVFPYGEWHTRIKDNSDSQKDFYNENYNVQTSLNSSFPSYLTNEEKFFAMRSWAEALSELGKNAISLQKELEDNMIVDIPLILEFLRFMVHVDTEFIEDYLELIESECRIYEEFHLNSLFFNINQLLEYLIFYYKQNEYVIGEEIIRESYEFIGNGLFIMKNSREYIDRIINKHYSRLENLFSEKMKNAISRLPKFNINNPDIIKEIKNQSKISGKINKKKLKENLEYVIGTWLIKDDYLCAYLSSNYTFEYELGIRRDKKDSLCKVLIEFIDYLPTIIGHHHITQTAFFLTDAMPEEFDKIYLKLGNYIESEERGWSESGSVYDSLYNIVISKIGEEEFQDPPEIHLSLNDLLKYVFQTNAKITSIPLKKFANISERFYVKLLFDFIRNNRYSPPVSLWVKAKNPKPEKMYSKVFITSETLLNKTSELYALLSRNDIIHQNEEYLDEEYMNLSMEYDNIRRIYLNKHKEISYKELPREIELYFWIHAFIHYDYNILEYLYLTLSYTNLWFEKEDVTKALKILDYERLLTDWEYLCSILDTKYQVFRQYYSYFPFDDFL